MPEAQRLIEEAEIEKVL